MTSALETRHHDYYCLWCISADTVDEIYILPENSGGFRGVARGAVASLPVISGNIKEKNECIDIKTQ